MTDTLVLWHRLASRGRDDAGEPAAIAAWAKSVRARLLAAGGEVLAQVSGTVVAAFDPSDASDVLEVGLDLLASADEQQVAIALGIALGPIEEGAGRAVEVAELLAGRAQAGEMVLDPAARDRAEGLFLFRRQVSTGVGGPRGAAVDRAHPRREALAEGIARLRSVPIAPITAELVDDLVAHATADPLPAIVLRGPVGAGAVELVGAAARIARPRALISIGASSGGIVPLASLREGLLRAFGGDEAVVAACGTDDEGRGAGRILRTTLRGGLPPREALAAALTVLLSRVRPSSEAPSLEPLSPDRGGDGDVAPWLFLAPLAMVDAATSEVLLEARAIGAPMLLIARYPIDARLPGGIVPPVYEVTLPPLRTSDARAIAQAVLGADTDTEVARKVAVLGGETPLGVVEVARALIASGDLVASGEGFEWRGAPRGGAAALPLEEIVEERLERLDDESRRALEAICVAPEGADRALTESIAGRDGLGEKTRGRAIERLMREAWVSADGPWPSLVGPAPAGVERLHPSSTFVRRFVMQGMPPSRSSELHRFVVDALLERGADDVAVPSLRAELGFYEIEGGLEARGAPRLAQVARVAIDRGYRRAAARIAALLARVGSEDAAAITRAAVTTPPASALEDEQPPPSGEIALDALEPMTGPIELPGPATEPPGPIDDPAGQAEYDEDHRSSFVSAAEDAVRRRDVAALETLVQRAVASGSDMAAVARFRALSELLRGDVGGARRAIAKARSFRNARAGGDPRESIAEAAVALGSGDPGAAARLGLRALALARKAGDPRGEHAALRTLAACYRALGREGDAAALEAHAR